MLTPELKKFVNKQVLVQRIIWFAITGTVIFYFAIVYAIVGKGNSSITSELSGTVEIAFYLISVLLALGSIAYFRRSSTDENIQKLVERDVDLESLTLGKDNKRSSPLPKEEMDKLNPFQKKIIVLMYELQKTTMINLILNETIAVLGFVLAFLTGNPSKIIPFAVASLVLSIWMYPRPYALINRAEKFQHLAK